MSRRFAGRIQQQPYVGSKMKSPESNMYSIGWMKFAISLQRTTGVIVLGNKTTQTCRQGEQALKVLRTM